MCVEVRMRSSTSIPAVTPSEGTHAAGARPATCDVASLTRAFYAFAEGCSETGLVDRNALLKGLTSLVQAAHGTTAPVRFPDPSAVSLPVASAIRDALWQAGRSGRSEQLRAGVLAAQLWLGGQLER
jgi:hypothetical protein